jgi:hypothetical protein
MKYNICKIVNGKKVVVIPNVFPKKKDYYIKAYKDKGYFAREKRK